MFRSCGHSSTTPPWLSFSTSGLSFSMGLRPSCFTKTATPFSVHCCTILRAHARSNGRACGPLSPPTMTQSTRGPVWRLRASATASPTAGHHSPLSRFSTPGQFARSSFMLSRSSPPSSGSHDRKCTTAGMASATGTRRCDWLPFSTVVPIQTFGGGVPQVQSSTIVCVVCSTGSATWSCVAK